MTRATKVRLRYLVMGLSIGTFWFFGRDRPAWEEALRIVIVFTVVIVIFKALLAGRGIRIRLVPILITKVTLVIIAAAAEVLLGMWIPDPGVWVALALAVVIALGGPRFDRHLFAYERTTRTVQEAHE